MNRVNLIGRLTANPELRYTNSNIAFTKFSLAVNRTFSNANGERETDFINCIVWKKQAENVCKYLIKGSLIGIEGRIETSNFTDSEGNKKYNTYIVCDNVQFLESKKADSKENNNISITKEDVENHSVANDPFADFGQFVSIDDNFLD